MAKKKSPAKKGGAKPTKESNADKSAKASKVKRNMTMNKARGMSSPGNTNVAKALSKMAKGVMKKQVMKKKIGTPGMKSPAGKKGTLGLKISFKPAELEKTTDKSVSSQIKASLQRAGGPKPKMGGGKKK